MVGANSMVNVLTHLMLKRHRKARLFSQLGMAAISQRRHFDDQCSCLYETSGCIMLA
jgi:hypothetical protein